MPRSFQKPSAWPAEGGHAQVWVEQAKEGKGEPRQEAGQPQLRCCQLIWSQVVMWCLIARNMHLAAWYTACPAHGHAVAKCSLDQCHWQPLWWLGGQKNRRQDRYGGYKLKLNCCVFLLLSISGYMKHQCSTLFYRIPLLWSPKDHMQDTGDSRRFWEFLFLGIFGLYGLALSWLM